MPRDSICRFVLLESAIPYSSGFIRSVTVAEIICFILILRALYDLARLDSKCKKGLKCSNLKLHWCVHEYSDFSWGAYTAQVLFSGQNSSLSRSNFVCDTEDLTRLFSWLG